MRADVKLASESAASCKLHCSSYLLHEVAAARVNRAYVRPSFLSRFFVDIYFWHSAWGHRTKRNERSGEGDVN